MITPRLKTEAWATINKISLEEKHVLVKTNEKTCPFPLFSDSFPGLSKLHSNCPSEHFVESIFSDCFHFNFLPDIKPDFFDLSFTFFRPGCQNYTLCFRRIILQNFSWKMSVSYRKPSANAICKHGVAKTSKFAFSREYFGFLVYGALRKIINF